MSEEELTLEKIIKSCIESKQVEIENSKKTIDCTSESYNVKSIRVNALEKILYRLDAEHSQQIAEKTKQIGKLKVNFAIKNKKKKELEVLNDKAYKRLKAELAKDKERKLKLEAEAVSLQDAIEEGSKEVKAWQDKVIVLQKEHEIATSNVENLKGQVKD